MRKLRWLHRIVCVVLIAVCLTGCSDPSDKLRSSLNRYERITRGDIPSDIQLTIYYMHPKIFTQIPLSIEGIKNFPATEKIVVSAEELAPYWEDFRKLNSSVLQPIEEEPRLDVRLYYVLETSTSQKLLEVVTNDVNCNFFVNGIEVEYNSLFIELIWPFLPEDARTMYPRDTVTGTD